MGRAHSEAERALVKAAAFAMLAYVAFPTKASLFLLVRALRFGSKKRGCAGGVAAGRR